jgi:acetoin utilization deacetylase AcuC-like enzyme
LQWSGSISPPDRKKNFVRRSRSRPKLQEFRPDLIVISAGFDAHRLDPLANLNLSEGDFGWGTLRIMEIADQTSAGKVISMLEGGYALESLAQSVAAHVTAPMQS